MPVIANEDDIFFLQNKKRMKEKDLREEGQT